MLDTINVIQQIAKSNVESLEESSFSSSSDDEVIVKWGSISDRVNMFEAKSTPILDVDTGKDRIRNPVRISHLFLNNTDEKR